MEPRNAALGVGFPGTTKKVVDQKDKGHSPGNSEISPRCELVSKKDTFAKYHLWCCPERLSNECCALPSWVQPASVWVLPGLGRPLCLPGLQPPHQ